LDEQCLRLRLTVTAITPKFYKAAGMQLSADGRILFGTVISPPRKPDADDSDSDDDRPQQSRPPPSSPAAPPYGFLTATLLSAPPRDPALTGFPLQLLLQVQTTTSGGQSNAAVPAPWSRAHVALADSERARVQVWRIDGLAGALPSGESRGATGRDVFSEEALRRVRASIVAEWQAPKEDVGVAEKDRRSRAVGAAEEGRAAGVPLGRGCCADLVWLD
jgi:hypothetical protein